MFFFFFSCFYYFLAFLVPLFFILDINPLLLLLIFVFVLFGGCSPTLNSPSLSSLLLAQAR